MSLSYARILMGVILVLILGLVLLFVFLVVFFELFFSLHCVSQQSPQSLPTTVASPSANHQKRRLQDEVVVQMGGQSVTGTSAYYSHGVLQLPPCGHLFHEENNGEVRVKNGLHFFGLLSPATSVVKEECDVESVAHRSVNFMRISNPIYGDGVHLGTSPPFVTPDTSPSQMDEETDDEDIISPPLTYMQKLPAFGLFRI